MQNWLCKKDVESIRTAQISRIFSGKCLGHYDMEEFAERDSMVKKKCLKRCNTKKYSISLLLNVFRL